MSLLDCIFIAPEAYLAEYREKFAIPSNQVAYYKGKPLIATDDYLANTHAIEDAVERGGVEAVCEVMGWEYVPQTRGVMNDNSVIDRDGFEYTLTGEPVIKH